MTITFVHAGTSEKWNLVNQSHETKIWLFKTNSEVTSAYQTSTPKSSIDWSKFNEKNFFKKFEANKEKSLKAIGIKNWKIEGYKWSKTPFGHELVTEGMYLNPSNKKIHYREIQIYKEQKTYQILNTWPETFSSGKELSSDFVKDLREELEEI